MLYDDMYIYDLPYYWTELLDVFQHQWRWKQFESGGVGSLDFSKYLDKQEKKSFNYGYV